MTKREWQKEERVAPPAHRARCLEALKMQDRMRLPSAGKVEKSQMVLRDNRRKLRRSSLEQHEVTKKRQNLLYLVYPRGRGRALLRCFRVRILRGCRPRGSQLESLPLRRPRTISLQRIQQGVWRNPLGG